MVFVQNDIWIFHVLQRGDFSPSFPKDATETQGDIQGHVSALATSVVPGLPSRIVGGISQTPDCGPEQGGGPVRVPHHSKR